jgi:predicted small lipoprotein YifL
MKTELRLLIAFITCLFFSVACGQKGPLFLPGSPSTIQTTISDQQPAPVEEFEDDEDDEEEKTNNIN